MRITLDIEWIEDNEYSVSISNPILGSEQADVELHEIWEVVGEYIDPRRGKIEQILKGE